AMGGGIDSATAKKTNPDYVRAKDLIKAWNYAAAVPLLQAVVAAEPKNPDAHNDLGYSQRKLGDRQAALTSYLKAIELKPKHLGANEYLGELYLEMGQLEKAQGRLEVLDGACFFGCEEYRDLKAAIKAYRAKSTS
ncbi:MAG: tetratricopeptide repeat protein, partial [Kiloniellales bacterium]